MLARIHVVYRVIATVFKVTLYVRIDRVVDEQVFVVVVEYELVQEEEVGDGAHKVAGVVVLGGRIASVVLEHVEGDDHVLAQSVWQEEDSQPPQGIETQTHQLQRHVHTHLHSNLVVDGSTQLCS